MGFINPNVVGILYCGEFRKWASKVLYLTKNKNKLL